MSDTKKKPVLKVKTTPKPPMSYGEAATKLYGKPAKK